MITVQLQNVVYIVSVVFFLISLIVFIRAFYMLSSLNAIRRGIALKQLIISGLIWSSSGSLSVMYFLINGMEEVFWGLIIGIAILPLSFIPIFIGIDNYKDRKQSKDKRNKQVA